MNNLSPPKLVSAVHSQQALKPEPCKLLDPNKQSRERERERAVSELRRVDIDLPLLWALTDSF